MLSSIIPTDISGIEIAIYFFLGALMLVFIILQSYISLASTHPILFYTSLTIFALDILTRRLK